MTRNRLNLSAMVVQYNNISAVLGHEFSLLIQQVKKGFIKVLKDTASCVHVNDSSAPGLTLNTVIQLLQLDRNASRNHCRTKSRKQGFEHHANPRNYSEIQKMQISQCCNPDVSVLQSSTISRIQDWWKKGKIGKNNYHHAYRLTHTLLYKIRPEP